MINKFDCLYALFPNFVIFYLKHLVTLLSQLGDFLLLKTSGHTALPITKLKPTAISRLPAGHRRPLREERPEVRKVGQGEVREVLERHEDRGDVGNGEKVRGAVVEGQCDRIGLLLAPFLPQLGRFLYLLALSFGQN